MTAQRNPEPGMNEDKLIGDTPFYFSRGYKCWDWYASYIDAVEIYEPVLLTCV